MDYLDILQPLNQITLSRETNSVVDKLLNGETITPSELNVLIGGEGINPSDLTDGLFVAKLNVDANYLQSSNFVSGSSGWRIDANGDLEANSGTFRGNLEANTLHIPDQNTTADSFHVESDGDTFWGCTQDDFTSDINNAKAYVLKNGLAKFSNLGQSTQYIDSDGNVIKILSLVSAIGPLGLHSYTDASLPEASPTDALSPSAIGDSNWTNPTNAYASDDTYATIATAGVEQIYKTFGLGTPTSPLIPHGSTLLGIKVEVECQGDAADMEVAVRLSPDEGTTWSSYKTNTPNNGSDTTLTFGGSTDLWTDISPYEWNTDTITDTYLRLGIQCSDLGSGTTLSVDHIKITVYYTSWATQGSLLYVSDGQKAGETSSGTGNLAFLDENGNWIAIDTGNTINSGLGLKLPRLASEPSGSAGQIFYDTNNSVFKGYDSSWKTLATTDIMETPFGGDGSDGALTDDTEINLGSATTLVKNYSSISIGSGHLVNFTNPHANGTIIIFRCSGDCTIAGELRLGNTTYEGQTGAAGGAGGDAGDAPANATSGGNGNDPKGEFDTINDHYGTGASAEDNYSGAGGGGGGQLTAGTNGTNPETGSGAGTGGAAQSNFAGWFNENHIRKTYFVSCGAGGGGGAGGDSNSPGAGDSGNGGDGGRGGGVLILEVAGNLTVTGGSITANGANGEDGEECGNYGDPNFPRNGGAGGGGAGGTVIVLYKGTLTGTLTPSVAGGTGGTGGNGGGAAGGNGGNGAAGYYIFEQYIW